MLCGLILGFIVSCVATAGSSPSSGTEATAGVSGYVRTAEGKPVPGIPVRCFYFRQRGSDFPYQNGEQVTDENGRYEFRVPAGYEHYVDVAPRKSTFAKSERFDVPPGQEVHVKDLVVRPVTGRLTGRIVHADGQPAGGLEFAFVSGDFGPYRAYGYPKTDANGLFDIHNVPADANIAFWAVPDPNHIQVWTGIRATASSVEFRLNPQQYEEMPPEWRKFEDAADSARDAAEFSVQKRIGFTLPGLDGPPTSLSSERFKGKVTLINLFGSWCGGCRIEMPHLVRLKDKYSAQGLEIVGIAFEQEQGDAELRKLLEEARVNYPVLLGGSPKVVNVMATIKGIDRFYGYPTTIVLGRDGQVKYSEVGIKAETKERTEWWSRKLENKLVELLKNSP